MKRLLPAVTAIALCLGGPASAQSDPGDAGTGTKLGIQQLNNSGQIGSVTLFTRGSKTLVNVSIDGAPNKAEAVAIHRGSDCDAITTAAAYRLKNLGGGRSSTTVNTAEDRLLSGNYNVVVYGGTQPSSRAVACGHLYR